MKTTSRTATLVCLISACVYPTDRGAELRIEVVPIARLIRGDSVRVDAQLIGPDGLIVPNARFSFLTADRNVAVVTTDGLVIAVNAGTTTVNVRAVGTAGTPAAQLPVAVSGTVSVDSLRPITAKWGQLVSLYGSGLEPDTSQVVTIDDVPVSIASYQPDDSARPNRFGALQVVVAPPLQTGGFEKNVNMVVATSHGTGGLSSPLTVEPLDIFEPNSLTPADLGTITGPREFLGLAMEAAHQDTRDIDWYTFTTTAQGDWTIEVRVPPEMLISPLGELQAGLSLFPDGGVEAELTVDQGSPPHNWIAYYPDRGSVAGGLNLCRGRGAWDPAPFTNSWPFGAVYSRIVSLRNVPAGQHDLLVNWASQLGAVDSRDQFAGFFRNLRPNQWAVLFGGAYSSTTAVRYDLLIHPGVMNGPVPPDPYEPNDFCEDARSLLTLGAAAFADSAIDLTLDGPADEDWFQVDVQHAGFLEARVSPDTAVFAALLTADADSAVFVGYPFGGSIFSGGASLQPGPYYLLVTGPVTGPRPTPYQLTFSWTSGASLIVPQRGRP